MANKALNLNPKENNAHKIYQKFPCKPAKQERFNEEYDDVVSNARSSQFNAKNLNDFNRQNQAKKIGPRSVFSSHYSKASRIKSAAASRKQPSVTPSYSTHQATIESHKKKIIDAVNNLTEEELEKVSEML